MSVGEIALLCLLGLCVTGVLICWAALCLGDKK